jgi:mono/diheme cytochrome c family protein
MRRVGQLAAASALVVLAGVGVAACGKQDVSVPSSATQLHRGAVLFAERCSGCHTLTAAGTQGSSPNVRQKLRTNGPNFDQRREQAGQVLYAIRNGGFSGAIMPQDVVVGPDAVAVAAFVAKYAGKDAKSPPGPGQPSQQGG